uniref:Uncharacterized protein n=1 Tax=Glossina morsitans morsitans TaxID=37546 RepID=A0A1B0F9B9_GLOMM
MMSLEINSSRAQVILKNVITTTNDNKSGSIINKSKRRNRSRVHTDKQGITKPALKTNPAVEESKRSQQSEESEYKAFVGKILHTVSELEHYLVEDHQQDYKLRMALERQKERVSDLSTSLANEKRRNKRLVDLIRNVDSVTSEEEELGNGDRNSNKDRTLRNGRGVVQRWPLNASNEAYESISPLLMHQRYDELSTSYKQCRRQLLKKEKQVAICKCEKERLQAQYDQLMDEYRSTQKRFEGLCCRYLRLQKRKNLEIQQLRETLTHASDCVIGAQLVMDKCEGDHAKHGAKEFNQNLQHFIKSLHLCEWTKCSCSSIASQEK